MRAALLGVFVAGMFGAPALGQTPQPFPRPGNAPSQAPAPASGAPQAPRPAPSPAVGTPPTQTTPGPLGAPSAETLGFPVFPAAQFIASYDAGRGQRYYLFGSTAAYADVIAFYRTQLRDKGDEVFSQPPTHMFQVGRFRDETMSFPPGVTVKDWTWGGSQGYPNPKLGAEPARYPSMIMIVPAPPGTPTR